MLYTAIISRVVYGCLLGLLFLPSQPSVSVAHEIPDKFVERSLSIVVRDQVAFLTYRAGLNIKTMRTLMREWSLPPGQYAETLSDEQLSKHFRDAAFDQIARGLKVSLDGQPVVLHKIDCEPSPRHHFSLVAKYKIDLGESSKPFEFEVIDENFPTQQGAIRCSLKAMGNAMVLQSNVAPIMVRAERHELENLSASQRKAVCSVKVKLAFSPD